MLEVFRLGSERTAVLGPLTWLHLPIPIVGTFPASAVLNILHANNWEVPALLKEGSTDVMMLISA
jgi:hypothetical protein